MYPAGQEITVKNNGVGLVNSSAQLPIVVGYASGLTANTLAPYTDPNTFRDAAGSGPLVEPVLAAISKAGGALVLAVAASVAGVISAVTPDRVDSSSGTVAVTGTPQLSFDGRVEIVRGGAKGVGRYRYTLDGESYGAVRVIPLGGSFALPGSGLTLGFTGTPGSSAVTQTGSGPAVTVTGTPAGEYSFRIEVTTGGTIGTAVFRWSSNGGTTWTSGVTTASTVLLGSTGVTANFAAGTYVLSTSYVWTSYTSVAGDFEEGDVFTFTTTAPHYTTSDLAPAMTALRQNIGSRKIRRLIFTGQNADTGDGAVMAAAVATHLADLEGYHYFARALLDTGLGTAAECLSDFSGFSDDRVGVCFSEARCIVRAAFEGYANAWMPYVRALAERVFEADLSENLGRKASGSMSWVTEIRHDEGVNTLFTEADKINTTRTYLGETGFYPTNGYLRSPSGSDFLYWDWGCTVDELCEGIEEGQAKWLLSKLRAKTDGSGNLDKSDARRVEDAIRSILSARLTEPQNVEGTKGHVSGFAYAVSLTNNFLATREIESTGHAVPLSPVEGFRTVVGLTRSL